MSYFDYFSGNININSDVIKGTCFQMCPQEEIAMREKEKLVHVLEVMGPERKLVKSFSRSAADANMAVSRRLRPFDVLRNTVQYLLLEVTKRSDVPATVVYDFVNDRLRAVRQDITIQRLPPEECIQLLDPMIRFHVFYGYELCELPIKNYDPMLNKKYLLECLKWFLTCCDTIAQSQRGDAPSGCLAILDKSPRSGLVCDKVLMESLYIMCNLDDVHPLLRYLSLPQKNKNEPKLQLAYKIAVANLKGNYVQVCRLLESLCPLSYCALCLYLPVLQRRALQVMSHAYHSKQLTVPSAALQRWLRLDAPACRHYGLEAGGGAARFDRAQYSRDAPTLQPKKLCDDKFNLTMDYIFTYK